MVCINQNADFWLQIRLGINNQVTRIESDSGVEQVVTPNVLDCNKQRSFWVSWIDNEITLGSGTTFLRNLILAGGQSQDHNVNAINIATSGTRGYWMFEEDRGLLSTEIFIMLLITSGYIYNYYKVDQLDSSDYKKIK